MSNGVEIKDCLDGCACENQDLIIDWEDRLRIAGIMVASLNQQLDQVHQWRAWWKFVALAFGLLVLLRLWIDFW